MRQGVTKSAVIRPDGKKNETVAGFDEQMVFRPKIKEIFTIKINLYMYTKKMLAHSIENTLGPMAA